MKKIEAIIRPDKLLEVKKALNKAGFPAMTTFDVRGSGKEQGLVMRAFDGSEIKVELLPKQKVEIVVNDKNLNDILKIVIENAKTGNIGDGKIFVSTIDEELTVRTGDRLKEV